MDVERLHQMSTIVDIDARGATCPGVVLFFRALLTQTSRDETQYVGFFGSVYNIVCFQAEPGL